MNILVNSTHIVVLAHRIPRPAVGDILNLSDVTSTNFNLTPKTGVYLVADANASKALTEGFELDLVDLPEVVKDEGLLTFVLVNGAAAPSVVSDVATLVKTDPMSSLNLETLKSANLSVVNPNSPGLTIGGSPILGGA